MTIIQLHRATQVQCPPCHGQCDQGRACNAQGASASSELLEDADPYDETALVRGVLSAIGIVAVVAACAGLGYILPLIVAAPK